ncbi:MAG: tryptophan 7-halogenase [Cyanobacteria bacterium P01_F01_bin.143]
MIENIDITTDVVIVGSGPAGLAAALSLLLANMQVVIVEARNFPRDRCGESLHPGVESLLKHIDAQSILKEAEYLRFGGIWFDSLGEQEYHAFGSDEDGPWQGYQAWGADFDSRLQALALARGAQLITSKATGVLKQGDRVVGIETSCGLNINAKVTLDASGRKHWLASQLEIPIDTFSPKLMAQTKYLEINYSLDNEKSNLPRFSFDKYGWTWQADIKPNLRCVTRLDWDGRCRDTSFHNQAGTLGARGGDVTWRCVSKLAGEGYFILGDSAMVLDPASSRGVIMALLSGVITAEYAAKIIVDQQLEVALTLSYERQMKMRFHNARRNLIRIYRKSNNPPPWLS